MLLTSRGATEAARLCCRSCVFEDMPPISFVWSANRASSGAIRKNLVRALRLRVMPVSPPVTFMERLTCPRALFALSAQNGTSGFLLTTQFPWQIPQRPPGSIPPGKPSQLGTVEPRYNDVPRDWENYIDISGYRYKRIPDITILEKNNKHLMTGPEGNSEFCLPGTLNVASGNIEGRGETKLTVSRGVSS